MRFYVPVDILAADFSHLLHGRGVTVYAHTGENAMRLHQEPIPAVCVKRLSSWTV